MATTNLCERSVVIVTSPKHSDLAEKIRNKLRTWGGVYELAWNGHQPDESLEAFRSKLDGADRAIVTVQYPSAKGIRQIAATARKKGYVPYVLESMWEAIAEKVDNDFEIVPMRLDKRYDKGPFTIIGDIHGCADELMELLEKTGHVDAGWENLHHSEWHKAVRPHADGRRVILLGDLVDRGQKNLATMQIARALEEIGGYRVLGNHDSKIGRWLKGNKVSVGPHQQPTIDEFMHMTSEERYAWGEWLLSVEGHYILDEGRLVVAHAGMDEENLGRATEGAHAMALYGKPTGEVDEEGYPVAADWAREYHGDATVVHGHVVHEQPRETNGKVIAIDTGCVFGGTLTALQWPEKTYVSVHARAEWWAKRTGD